MGKLAFIFPGQGSQKAGMGKDLADGFAEAKAVFDQVDAALGEKLSTLCFEGPDDQLKLTANTQPAILTVSSAAAAVLARGSFMQEAVPAGQGAMSAVLGLAPAKVKEICDAVAAETGGVVSPANYNEPAQTVIAGSTKAVEVAGVKLKEAGAKRVLPLPVSAPFHCAMMVPVKARLEPVLRAAAWKAPAMPVVTNVEAKPNSEVARIIPLLVEQVT